MPTFDVAALIYNGLRKVTPSNPQSRVRIILAVSPFLAAVVILLLLPAKPDPKSLRFVAGRPSAIGAYSGIGYEWPGLAPFAGGKVWIWTASSATNAHHYLYDLNSREVSGELLNGGPIFFNQDHSKLFCGGRGSLMMTFKERIVGWIQKLWPGKTGLKANRGEAFWILDLRDNSAKRIGEFSQLPGAGSTWRPSPTFRFGYNVPTAAPQGAFYLCDLERALFRKLQFDGKPQGWWDPQNILFKDSANNFVLLDVCSDKTNTLFTAEALAQSLQDLGLPNDPAPIGAFAHWNGRDYDTYFALASSIQRGKSFLLRADKTGPALKLVCRDFEFKWLGRLDEAGTRYLYDGESGQPDRGGNGGVFLRSLTNNTSRTVVEPDNGGQYAIARFYGDDIIYFRNRLLWRLAPGETNSTQLLPPTSH